MPYLGHEPNGSFTTNVSKDTFDGDGSTTAFTLTEGASTNTVDVFVENVRQEPTEAYSVDGTTLTFTAAPPTGTGNIYVVNKSPVRLQAAHPAGLALEAHSATISTDLTVGGTATFSDDVDVNGNEIILDADGDTSITADTDDQIDFKTGGTDRMVINSSGNVGIGTTSPDAIIETSASATGNTVGALLTNTNQSGTADSVSVNFGLGRTVDGFIRSVGAIKVLKEQQWTSAASTVDCALAFSTVSNESESECMRIDSNGNVLVGTTTAGISNSLSTTIETSGYNNSRIYVNHSSSGSSNNSLYMGFGYGGNTIGSIRQNSTTSVSYVTTSDYRLKENAVAISDGITRVKSLQPKRFNFIADQSTTVDGFMAHEVATVVPEAISGTHNEVETWTQDEIDAGDAPANTSAGDNKLDGEGNTIPVYQGIDQAKLVPLLTAALQEAITKIETLETKVAALEATD